MMVAEKIREKVEATTFKVSESMLKKTISLGVTDFSAESEGFWHCIKFADVALYKAKERDRNRCVRFSSDMWKEVQF